MVCNIMLVSSAVVLVIFVVNSNGAAVIDRPSTDLGQRDSKFFNIFNVVSFLNTPCNGTNNTMQGLCYSTQDCNARGGTPQGSCAQGFGVCCVLELSCRSNSSNQLSYFTNPARNASEQITGPCDMRIDVVDRNVCQLRLDFDIFEIAEPRELSPTSYKCRDSKLQIINRHLERMGVTEWCGNNTGQHVYIPVDPTSGRDSVALFFTLSQSSQSRWRIKIQQIRCIGENVDNMAPRGCLQYYTGRSGIIESFNFNNGTGRYIGNQRYAICIQRTPDTCRVEFSSRMGEFRLQEQSTTGMSNERCVSRPTGTSPTEQIRFHGDYLMIPESTDALGMILPLDKFCGSNLNFTTASGTTPPMTSPVYSRVAGPITLNFITDDTINMGATATKDNEVGFRVRYQQLNTGC